MAKDLATLAMYDHGSYGHAFMQAWVWLPWPRATRGLVALVTCCHGLVSMASEGLVALAVYGHGFGCHGYVPPRVWYLLGINENI